VLVSLEMAAALSKTLKEVDALQAQMKEYLEDSAKAKNERDYYKRELERLKTEAKFKNDQINLFAKANNNE
jgi:DNA repair exonuclease SbcCD ATPase subunit